MQRRRTAGPLARLKCNRPTCYRHLMSFLITLCGIALLFFIYQMLALGLDTAVLPRLEHIAVGIGEKLTLIATYQNFGMTFYRLLLVLAISGAVGGMLGLMAGYYHWLYQLLRPAMMVLKAFPTICLALVLLVFTRLSSYLVLFAVTLPIVYEAVCTGAASVRRRFEEDLSLCGVSDLCKIKGVILPLTGPFLLLGILQSSGLGLKVLIMAEVLTGSTSSLGIGNLVNNAYLNSRYGDMFVYSFLAVAIIMIFDLVLAVMKSRVEKSLSDHC